MRQRAAAVPPTEGEAVPRLPGFLAASAVAGWGLFILFRYYRVFPVQWGYAGSAFRAMASAAGRMTGPLLWEHVISIAAAAAVLAGAAGLGALLLRLLGLSLHDRLESWVFRLGLGCGALAYAMLALALAGGLYRLAVWAVILGSAAVGLFWERKNPVPFTAPDPESVGKRFRRLPLLDKAAWLLLGLEVLFALFSALTPLIFYDSLVYHLEVPGAAVVEHRFPAFPYNIYAHMPMTVPFLYAAGLAVKDEMAAKVLNFALGLLSGGAVLAFCRRFAVPRAGPWAALIFYSILHVFYASLSCGTDLGIALFCTLAIYAFTVWRESAVPSQASGPGGAIAAPYAGGPWLCVSAVFAGFAMASKYTSVFLPAAMLASLALFRRSFPWRAYLRAAALVVLIGGAVLSPWLVKNWVYKRNPVFPFLTGLFRQTRDADPEKLQSLFKEASQYDIRGVKDYLRLPWDATMGKKGNSEGFTPLFLIFLPVLLLLRRYPGWFRTAAAAAGLFALAWSFTSTLVRYLMPAFPFLAVLLGYALTSVRLPGLRFFRTLVLAVCIGGFLECLILTYNMEGWRPALGLESKDDYLSRTHMTYPPPSYPLFRFADQTLPPDARLLLVGEPRAFYLRRGHVANSVFDREPLLEWSEASPDAAALRGRLRAEGITHLLINLNEARRSKDYKGLLWKPHGWEVMRSFWPRYVREVRVHDEKKDGQWVNRSVLYELLSEEEAARPHPAPRNLLSDLSPSPA